MEMKVTSRDKMLLSLLACILILVGFIRYLIIPMSEKSGELDTQIDQAQMTKQEMEMRINSYPAIQENYKNARIQANQLTADYYDVMTSQEVDRELTNIVVGNDLECTNLNIQALDFADVQPYLWSAAAREELLEELMDSKDRNTAETASSENAPSDETTPEDTVSQQEIFAYRVSMTMEGTEENYQKIIDLFVNGYPAVRVTGISYQDGKMHTVLQPDGSIHQEEGLRQLVLNLELYLCDKSLYTVEEDISTEGQVVQKLLEELNLNAGEE